MCIDFGTTWFCKEKLHWNKYLANSCGFTLAVVSNYFINRWWTFESHDPEVLAEFSKFLLISLAGLALNNLFVYFFHQKAAKGFYFSKLMATIIVVMWNFSANFFFNFKG